MPELIQTLKSMTKTEEDKRIFLAAIQGIELGKDKEETEGPTFDDVRLKALGIEASKDDIVSLQGQMAAESGFGIGAGLGYSKE